MFFSLWDVLEIMLLLIIAAFGFLHIFGTVPSLHRYSLVQKIPGPKGIFYFGNVFQYLCATGEENLKFILDNFKHYERFMRTWLLGFSIVYLKDPNDIQVILSSTENLAKGLEYYILHLWLGQGLLTSTGEKWQTRRKLFTPAFHFKILEENLANFNRNAKILTDKLKQTQGTSIILEDYITLCTLDVIAGTAMGIDLKSQFGAKKYVNELKKLSELVSHRMMSPHLFNDSMFYISPSGRAFRKTVKQMHDFSESVIREKTNTMSNRNQSDAITTLQNRKVRRAFLDIILEQESKDPGTFPCDDIREEVDTFVFEGHDTTAAAIVFILFNLARYPDIQEKVFTEQCEIFLNSERDVTTEDLHKMSYLEKVIKESLRLYPSVPAISRLLQKDLTLNDGTIIPSFTNVVIPFYVLHRNEKYWPDPEKFDPNRFSDEESQGRHPFAYLPFSAGPRNCIGQKFAMMELKTLISIMVRKLKIEPLTKEKHLNLAIMLVLRSTVPIKCKFYERTTSCSVPYK